MFEIEQKAHVIERNKVISLLNDFATFDGILIKDDEYFRFDFNDKPTDCTKNITFNKHITARFRCVERFECSSTLLLTKDFSFSNANPISKQTILTYKKKETRECKTKNQLNKNTHLVEVNEENETELSNPNALKIMFQDLGFTKYLTKHKDALSWYCTTEQGNAHIELCSVPPLGDFLEIEIMSISNEQKKIYAIKSTIESLFIKAGLSLTDIEEKYYSEMLLEKN